MSRELAYLLSICGLMVVPGLLKRLRIPPPLFLYAGPEVDLATLRGAVGPLSVYLLIRVGAVAPWRGWPARTWSWAGRMPPCSRWLLYAGLSTLLPSFILRASYDVAPSPLKGTA